MIYQARTEANELFIAMYETEEPTKQDAIDYNGDYCGYKHRELIEQWQSSKREYKVRDIDQSALRVLLEKEAQRLNPSVNSYNGELAEALEKGIDCTFLKDRLRLESDCCKGGPLVYGCIGCSRDEDNQYWTLLPLEDKKENEAGKWISVKDRLPEPIYPNVMSDKVLSITSEGGMLVNTYSPMKGYGWIHFNDCVTHWMPLPEPPTIQEPE